MLIIVAAGIVIVVFWRDKKHNEIHVEFVEVGQQHPFAASKVPIAQLPDTFEIDTTLDLDDKKWRVVDAIPKLKTEFEKSGKLTVILSPQQLVNPKDILFSLPTINDRMCALLKAGSLDRILVIHEDDWRQIEFISENLAAEVNAEILDIQAIYDTKRQGIGFTSLHVRKRIEEPIPPDAIPLAALKQLFTIAKSFAGFGLGDYKAVAENGFAFETNDGLRFYGVSNEKGNVVFLCLDGANGFPQNCTNLLRAFNLLAVNWCKCQVIRSNTEL